MIQFNLVARINDDKNSFLDLVYTAYQLKISGFEDFNILFIGGIYNKGIYHNIVRMAELLHVSSQISLTMQSVPMAGLPENIKQGFFVNLCVGEFIGYSGIESIRMGFKNIFYNCDPGLAGEPNQYINVCRDIDELIALFKLIMNDCEGVSRQINLNAGLMKEAYALSEPDKNTLLSMLVP
jgi:hypothetical protein